VAQRAELVQSVVRKMGKPTGERKKRGAPPGKSGGKKLRKKKSGTPFFPPPSPRGSLLTCEVSAFLSLYNRSNMCCSLRSKDNYLPASKAKQTCVLSEANSARLRQGQPDSIHQAEKLTGRHLKSMKALLGWGRFLPAPKDCKTRPGR